ncbi:MULTISPECIES: hypothetical protein [unclassified Roseitalea]|uniref:hypothetical protein n=1 Tax=unclassified Roseitalea TaxID=2639107 RepID=UPI00273F1893|nr:MULTISPECIES: hypothetical protein [unclassified Roseitalea]
MLLTIVGAVVLAIASVGLVSMAFRLTGRRAPRGLLPLIAGIAMFGFMAWNENSWYARTVADLPESHVVVATGEFSNAIQPWTLVFPRINRFMVVDTRTIAANENAPGLRRAEVILAQRYTPTVTTRQFIDCDNARRADHTETTRFDDRGVPLVETWVDLSADDRLLEVICTHQLSAAADR